MASDGQWQFQIHDTATGRLLDRVHPASGSWTRRMSGEGSGSHVFKLSDADYDRSTWRDLFETWERTLVVCWSYPGVLGPIYAGIITGTTYDPTSGTVTVEHAGIRDLLDARLTFANGNYRQGGLWINGKSPWGALRTILERATGNTGRGLPFDYTYLPDTAGDISLGWAASQVATIADCISDLEALGYETNFVPQFRGDHEFSWAPTIGTRLEGPTVEMTMTAAESPMSDVSVQIDGTNRATSVFAAGNGSGEDMVAGWWPSGVPNVPIALERTTQAKRQQDSMTSVARAEYETHQRDTVQWSFTVDVFDSDHTPATFVPTNLVRVHTWGDPWLSDQVRTLRVIALAGDMTNKLKPEVQ